MHDTPSAGPPGAHRAYFDEETEFILPRGLTGADGSSYRHGRMRMATALDEVEALADPRVARHGAYLGIALLARVVTDLGGWGPASTELIERLPSADYAFLQQLYLRLNDPAEALPMMVDVVCPACGEALQVEVDQPGGAA